MSKKKITIALLILVIALGFVSYTAAIFEQIVYLPVVIADQIMLTPTLAPTQSFYPTSVPIEICIPSPCEGQE